MIKMIATDIDGTIMRYDFQLNREVKNCIEKLTEIGIKVVLVTGRMHSATDYIAEDLNLKTPIVSYQGGLIKCGEKILYEKNLNPKTARSILNWAKKNDIHLNLYMNDKLFVEEENETIQKYARGRADGYRIKSFDGIELNRINKLLGIDFNNYDKVTSWVEYLTQNYDDIYVVKSTPYFCEVSHPEAKKSSAVEFLTNYYGFKKEEVMTIGDQNNDIELLKAGGIKVAMGNATEELKNVADYITDTVNNNGFVKAVERFVEGYNEVRL